MTLSMVNSVTASLLSESVRGTRWPRRCRRQVGRSPSSSCPEPPDSRHVHAAPPLPPAARASSWRRVFIATLAVHVSRRVGNGWVIRWRLLSLPLATNQPNNQSAWLVVCLCINNNYIPTNRNRDPNIPGNTCVATQHQTGEIKSCHDTVNNKW